AHGRADDLAETGIQNSHVTAQAAILGGLFGRQQTARNPFSRRKRVSSCVRQRLIEGHEDSRYPSWPNWKLANVIEEAGATIVADTLCSGTQRLFDPVQVDEPTLDGLLRALALRYFSASICPCFADSADRIDRLLELSADFKVRGVVSHNLRLCQLFDMESARVRQALRQKDIPLLAIQTDYGQEDVEQVKTRVEAFLEMLRP
ncbi:MAG: 2-hydroxyacyl-CoA dehydratase, partial [Planctomycetes bacterium]|nr:2-hydroxyacyl-CoA dehydratase [Planctomycetota bacterium]